MRVLVAGVAGVALRGRRDRSTAGACAGGGGARRGGHHQKSGQDRRPARAGLRRRGARRAGCRRRRRGSRSCRTGRDRSSDDGSGRDGRQPAEFRPSLRYDERAADRGHPSFVGAAAASGVPRFVAQSFTGWPNTRTGGRVKTEQDSLDGAPPDAQRRTLSAIRYLERAVTHAPLHGVVLRYGLLYGPGASEKFAEMILAGKFPLVGAGTGVWSFAHVDDATSMTPRRRRWQRSGTGHRCLRRRRRRTRRGGGVAAVPRAGPRCTRAAAPAGLAGQAGRG